MISERKNVLSGFFREIGAILKDLWNTMEDTGFCCGIRLDSRGREYMPSASSCCGVRA